MEVLGIVLAVLAILFVDPGDAISNLRKWLIGPTKLAKRTVGTQSRLDLTSLFDALGIEDMRIEKSFIGKPAGLDSFDAEVIEHEPIVSPYVQKLRARTIQEEENFAKKNGKTFDNNGTYALRRVDVSRPEGVDGKRHNVHKLLLEKSSFYNFVFPNLCLDKLYPTESGQEEISLRKILSMEKSDLSIATLTDHPNCQFPIGVGTLVVTQDNYLVCTARSRHEYIAGKLSENEVAVHLSTAEGMYRSEKDPASGDCLPDGRPSPFVTSMRSLDDELNLQGNVIDIANILCLGYFFDTKRAQPLFIFHVKPNISSKDLFSMYSETSRDAHENEAIFAIPCRLDAIRKLFEGVRLAELPAIYPSACDDFFKTKSSATVRLASNHAQTGLAIFAYKEFSPITRDMLA